MAHIDFKILNNLQLESDELHIVLKALSGELTDEEACENNSGVVLQPLSSGCLDSAKEKVRT